MLFPVHRHLPFTALSSDESMLTIEVLCSFLKGRKFPGTVRITRAGDDSTVETEAKAVSDAPPSRGHALSPGVEVAASYVDDRQSRSLQGEPSTSEQVQTEAHSKIPVQIIDRSTVCNLCPPKISMKLESFTSLSGQEYVVHPSIL